MAYLNDFVKSGFGSENTDETLDATSIKPIWHLTPLPLPSTYIQRPPLKSSFQELCLNIISRDFHLYTPAHLSSLPPSIISRILDYVRVQRRYENEIEHCNPDTTTLWAYQAALAPDSLEDFVDHTLRIPISNTLHYLKPDDTSPQPEHPFISIPKLYLQLQPANKLSFLTTLSLDGMNGAVTDDTILNLRYCTHLTVLWTKGCIISDSAIRLLSSSLNLEEKTGLCRLRAWFLPGCRAIGDKSMRSLAKWPGLVSLDVRDTSVTEMGMTILNRFSRSEFGGINADFQICTDGLRPLFSPRSTPAEILDLLCSSLITNPSKVDCNKDERWWLGLHLLPALKPLESDWLPHPPARPKPIPSLSDNKGAKAVYRPGIGMVYGQHAENVEDSITAYRTNLKTAMRIQAEEEGLCERLLLPREWEYDRYYREERVETQREKDRRLKGFKNPRAYGEVARTPAQTESTGRGRAKKAAQRSAGMKVDDDRDAEIIAGDPRLMLVRMVDPEWEKLRWAVKSTVDQGNKAVKIGMAQKGVAESLIADILCTQKVKQESQSTLTSPRHPTQASQRSSQPLSSSSDAKQPLSRLGDLSQTPNKPTNPFKTSNNPFSQRSTGDSQTASRPFSTQSAFSASQLSSPLDVTKRKRFGEISDGSEIKRRGMKMFSVKSKAT